MVDPYAAAGYTRQVPINMTYQYPHVGYSYGGYPGQVISPAPVAQGDECACVCLRVCACVCLHVCMHLRERESK